MWYYVAMANSKLNTFAYNNNSIKITSHMCKVPTECITHLFPSLKFYHTQFALANLHDLCDPFHSLELQ